MKPAPLAWHQGTTSSSWSWLHNDSSLWTVDTGWIRWAASSCSTVASDRPMLPTLPSATSSTSTPQDSSTGTSGSTRCSW